MNKIVFYLNTKEFGNGSFNGYESLKDFYCSTVLSLSLTKALHPLNPLSTKLVTDEKGKELLIDKNLIKIDKISVYEEENYDIWKFYCEEFPALHIKLDVFAFYDLPLNLYASDFLCFNIHYNCNLHLELANKILKIIGKTTDPIIADIKKAIKRKKVYSLNTSILGTNLKDLMRDFSIHVTNHNENTNEPLFIEFIESVYLYYYLINKKITISAVNPYIPEIEYIDFKFFLTERLSIFILGKRGKRNKLMLKAIENSSMQKEPLLITKLLK